MDLRAQFDKLKGVFTVGEGNSWLLGDSARSKRQRPARDNGRQADYGYDEAADYAGENAYPQQGVYQQQAAYPQQNAYPQQAAYPQQNAYQQQAAYPQQNAYQQQAAYPQQNAYQQQAAYPQQNAYQQPYSQGMGYVPQPTQGYGFQPAPESQPETPVFQSQFAPNARAQQPVQPQRNRRSQQHQQESVPENIVPFPGAENVKAVQPMDAYVINVFNIQACRQAMSCLRRGQCTLIIMDQLSDRNETRRFVDMLTGACYALGGTMTRLSTRIGFYLMAPPTMTVYTDAVTSNANSARPQAQMPLRQSAQDFMAQVSQEAPQMAFQQRQPQQEAPQAGYAPDARGYAGYEQPVYDPSAQTGYEAEYMNDQQRYAAL